MTANLVSFKGGPLPNEPQEEVIGLLEELLERAQVGDIQAIAVAYAAGGALNEVAGSAYEVGNGGHMFPLCSAVVALHHRFGVIMGGGEG